MYFKRDAFVTTPKDPEKIFFYFKAGFLRKFGRFGVPTPKFWFWWNVENISNISFISTYYLKVITLSFPTKNNYVFIFKIDRILNGWKYRKKPDFDKKFAEILQISEFSKIPWLQIAVTRSDDVRFTWFLVRWDRESVYFLEIVKSKTK